MTIKGIRYAGVSTAHFQAMCQFGVNVLGLQPAAKDTDFQELVASNGDRLELNGPLSNFPQWEFRPNQIMIGFLVDDIQAAVAELAKAPGVTLLGTIQTDAGTQWQDFRAPDGNV
ncbi:MAG TPA: hypothetical protein VGH38_26225, partial [Bryobacteraceae bacterium]